MPRPFVAYLRVYEPLPVIDAPLRQRVEEALRTRNLDPADAGDRERELWLKAQLAVPPRLLPCELADGSPAPNAPMDVLVLDPSEVPVADAEDELDDTADALDADTSGVGPAEVGPGPLVCPLDVRPRSAAALVGFLATAPVPLREFVLPVSADAVRARASAVMSELTGGAVHVVSSTWTVPLPWFALVDPDSRQVVLAPQDDPRRRVCWRMAMADARRRVSRAYSIVRGTIGEDGPAKVLRDTGRWLEHFHPNSAVELDYGGLVQLLDDAQLLADTSAHDVHAAVNALEVGDVDEVAELYERLRDFWADVAERERFN
ncbi:hypothetical protein [Streptoalloteichus tenebrarius]|uniref:hypothetical protein n=1 Tax=Streptoalloteichus tenebrarius (strain ATCC 17920 / DSM 40477 / JCM 4838 / CBS 697.72 / NBRC 16177 / NCIMB 11028 / NRRL B-12390 / A12253. 1 / ISP 5477) TaxID=1933 RepID=UPI0020A3D558|nr:hypothetical protein [Streptoalloteichus tenebrarius]